MIDMHYDLLSLLYMSYKNNDFSYVEEWVNNYNDNNVDGLIANLYFMSKDEMSNELGINYYNEEVSVLEMFKIVVSLFKKYLPNTTVLYSIEGCDYIKDTNELEELYKFGLRNILLVWNNKNKYGSGSRSDDGLTLLGQEFIKKAIDLGISVDVSHMNKKTFWDTIEVLKYEKSLGKNIEVMASHSNSYELCPVSRNLDDEQLFALREFNSVIGCVLYGPFVSTNSDSISDDEISNMFLEHIKRIVSIVGIDHVGVSTDDMSFAKVLCNIEEGRQIFNYETVKDNLTKLLSKEYNKGEIRKILYQNVYNRIF